MRFRQKLVRVVPDWLFLFLGPILGLQPKRKTVAVTLAGKIHDVGARIGRLSLLRK